jgi:hypothetical protein
LYLGQPVSGDGEEAEIVLELQPAGNKTVLWRMAELFARIECAATT